MTAEAWTRTILNICKILLALAIIALAVLFFMHVTKEDDALTIDEDSLVSNTLPAFEDGQLTAARLLYEVNQYRTNTPWTAISNEKIWAGLYNRTWSVDYSLEVDFKNEAGLLFGTGFGAYYNRTIWNRFVIGGVLIIDADKNIEAFGTAGYKW